MKHDQYQLNPNPLVRFLGKQPETFTREDLIRYIENNAIEVLNLRYVGGDGRLKALNFPVQGRKQLDNLLSAGERVDGSSLFNFLEAGSSDLYVVPRFRSAFRNPFSERPALDILCSYYDKDGNPLESAPSNILRKAHRTLAEKTGFELEVMGEIEYYVISEKNPMYMPNDQRGYHESEPFYKWGNLRQDAMMAMAGTGAAIKYSHAEVGNFSDEEHVYEQNEIEFLPVSVEDAADQLVVAKWILRQMAFRYGVTISFAPKITSGKAGSGMHIHMRVSKEGKNVTLENGNISDPAKRVIAGVMDLAPSLSAFGNTIPTSYLRLVPDQEAPTNVCWGERNRSALVRVPLGWVNASGMVLKENPLEKVGGRDLEERQTFEFRSPDGSADIYLLIAGLCVAARHGLEMPGALELARKTLVDGNIFLQENKNVRSRLEHLPDSCVRAAGCLSDKAGIYLKNGVFPKSLIDGVISNLRSYNDNYLRERISDSREETMKLVRRFLHCG